MNVAFDPWIPVVTLEGKPKLVSLCEVLTEGHLLADLSVRPHERVSLMRLFLCVAHASLDGPKDYDEWCEVPKRLPDAARRYLEAWKDAFELFHPTKPWLQIPNLESGKGEEEGWGPVSKLGFYMASGANTTLFDHDGMDNDSRKIALSATVLSMLAFQCFSLGGIYPQVFWGGVQTKKAGCEDSPCSPASMVHVNLRAKNLADTVWMNLPPIDAVTMAYNPHPIGRPIWEEMPTTPHDEQAAQNGRATYLGRLVPLSRFILLNSSGKTMLMGDGLAFPKFDKFPQEITAVVVLRIKDKKQERILLSHRPGRGFWRELGAIVVKRNAEGIGGPLSLHSLGEGDACDLIVSALARDQATIVDTTESVYHIPARLRSQEGLSAYNAGVEEAEDLSRRLGWAVEDYRRTLDGGWEGRLKSAGPSVGELKAKLHGKALMSYWTKIETQLGLLLAHVNALGSESAESTRTAWREILWQSARDAYASVCGQETPRQIKAFTEGWMKLHSRPKEQDETPKQEGAKI